jgi:hypothetical protein
MRTLAFTLCALCLPGLPAVQAEEASGKTATALTYSISIRDGRFNPERLEVPARTRFRLELANEGPGPLEFENPEMHVEKVLAAGGRSVIVLPGLPPGEHSFIDEFNPITGELKIIAK